MRIIDAHVHLGVNKATKYYSLKELKGDLAGIGGYGAVVFAFPEDMYRIADSAESRVNANKYCLEVARRVKGIKLYPFYFVWNDYMIPEGLEQYRGIKWHRHSNEPRYDYDSPDCRKVLDRIRELNLPVVLEEEYENTVRFIKANPGLNVIIPHMGNLNGGSNRMGAFFGNPRVYFDTSVAPPDAVKTILGNVGPERVIFGSDVSGTSEPFYNFPEVEFKKMKGLKLDKGAEELVFSGNILRLMNIKEQ